MCYKRDDQVGENVLTGKEDYDKLRLSHQFYMPRMLFIIKTVCFATGRLLPGSKKTVSRQ